MDNIIITKNLANWIVAIFFFAIAFYALAYRFVRTLRNSPIRASAKSRLHVLLPLGIWLFIFGLSIMIGLGALMGLPVDNLRCWLLIIPASCFSVPFILLGIYGTAVQLGWRNTCYELYNEIKARKNKQQ